VTGVTDCLFVEDFQSVALSATGRFVANLSASTGSLFVHDRETAQQETIPSPAGYRPASGIDISDDARYVVFDTRPTNCLPPPAPACQPSPSTFVHDRQTGIVESLPLTPPRAEDSHSPAISGDGRWVAYQIQTFEPFDPSGYRTSTWRYDRQTAIAEPVSVTTNGSVVASFGQPHISDDGRYVMFVSSEALDTADPTARVSSGLYVRDMVEGQTTLINRNVFGVPATEQVLSDALADDGRYVAFSSTSANLVGNDTNDASDVFLRAIPTPRIESLTPPSIPRGTTATLTVVGNGFAPAPTAGVAGTGVTVAAVTRVSEHELSVTITVDSLAPTGARTLSVTNTGTGPGPTAGDTGACVNCLSIT